MSAASTIKDEPNSDDRLYSDSFIQEKTDQLLFFSNVDTHVDAYTQINIAGISVPEGLD